MKKSLLYVAIVLLCINALTYALGFVSLVKYSPASQNIYSNTENWPINQIDSIYAQQLKLQPGDIILQVADKNEDSFFAVENDLLEFAGKTVNLNILRAGQKTTVQAQIPQDINTQLPQDARGAVTSKISFRAISPGKLDSISDTEPMLKQIQLGKIVIAVLFTLTIFSIVFLILGKKIGWYLGGILLFIRFVSALGSNQTTVIKISQVIYLLFIGVILVITYNDYFKKRSSKV